MLKTTTQMGQESIVQLPQLESSAIDGAAQVSSSTVADLPHLLQSLNSIRNEVERTAVLTSLTELLWDLRPEDNRFLPERSRKGLRKQLECGLQSLNPSESEADFLIAICKALTAVADRKTVRILGSKQKQEPADTNARMVWSVASDFISILEAEVAGRSARRRELRLHLRQAIESGEHRIELEKALAGMGVEAARIALREIIEEQIRPIRQGRILNIWIKASAGGSMFPVLFLSWMLGRESTITTIAIEAVFCLWVAWLSFDALQRLRSGVFYVPSAPPYPCVLTRAARALTTYASKEDIEPLLMAWQYSGRSLELEATITRLLQSMTIEDSHWLSTEARKYLGFLLTQWEDMPQEIHTAASRVLSLHEKTLPSVED